MRDTNINTIEKDDNEFEVLVIENLEPFEIEEYDLNDPKEFNKYIIKVKNIVRSSYEYREFTKFLRDYMDMNKCSFFDNVNNMESFKIRIEIHHHPFTLDDIVRIVYNKRMYFNESLSEEMVAKEVMYLHYCLLVGLIPLSETVHELVHNNYLFVPMNKVLGRVTEFINMYEQFMTPEQLEVLENNINFSKVYEEDSHKDILAVKPIYLDVSGAYKLPTYEQIIEAMNQRISYLKENPLGESQSLQSPFVRVEK